MKRFARFFFFFWVGSILHVALCAERFSDANCFAGSALQGCFCQGAKGFPIR